VKGRLVTHVHIDNWPEPSFWQSQLFAAIVTAGLALLVGIGLWQIQVWRAGAARKKRLSALLMLFLDEFIDAFGRCTMYCKQRLSGTVSYSSLHQPTDASMLAEFIGLCEDRELHESVFRLKAVFYQVANMLPKLADAIHRSTGLDDTNAAALDPDIVDDPLERERIRMRVLAARYHGAVIAFFLGQNREVYPRLIRALTRLLAAARKMRETDKGRIAFLEQSFEESHATLLKVVKDLPKTG